MASISTSFLVLFLLLFSFSTVVVRPSSATCLPRNHMHMYLTSSSSSSTTSSSATSSPSSSSVPQTSTPPPQQQASPPPQQSSPAPPQQQSLPSPQQQSPPPPQQQSPPTPQQQSPPTPQQQSSSPQQKQSPPPQQQQSPPPPQAPTSKEISSSSVPSSDDSTSSTFSVTPKAAGTTPAALQGVCKKTTFPDLCLSSINPLIASKPITGSLSLSAALELQMNAAKQQTQAAIAEFTKLASAPGTKPDVAQTLKSCAEKFSDALDNYETAMDALTKNDIPTVEIDLSAVLDDYESCTDGDAPEDAPVPGTGQAWVDKAHLLRNLTDNCLDLCAILK